MGKRGGGWRVKEGDELGVCISTVQIRVMLPRSFREERADLGGEKGGGGRGGGGGGGVEGADMGGETGACSLPLPNPENFFCPINQSQA